MNSLFYIEFVFSKDELSIKIKEVKKSCIFGFIFLYNPILIIFFLEKIP